jgi:hypothetical protein
MAAAVPSGEELITPNSASYPGVAIHGPLSSIDTGEGSLSSTNWNAQANTNILVSYSDLLELVPSDITYSNINFIVTGGSTYGGSPTPDRGYYWFSNSGDFTMPNGLSLDSGERAILFVDGNVTIEDNINLADPQEDFFMLVADGTIQIDPSVTSLQGIFVANSVETGSGDTPLAFEGSVVTSSISLQRDLDSGNQTTPATTFEYMEELLLNYPPTLSEKHLVWKEINP